MKILSACQSVYSKEESQLANDCANPDSSNLNRIEGKEGKLLIARIPQSDMKTLEEWWWTTPIVLQIRNGRFKKMYGNTESF
jgi:hypothetical protein